MRVLSFDWATKKALTVYDSKKNKVKSIPNSIDEFGKFLEKLDGNKITMLFEFGGGDTFKIMAFRAGHTILQVPGKKIKDYRDKLGREKSDEVDAKLIFDFFMENDGRGATKGMRNSTGEMPSPSKNKNGGGATNVLSKSIRTQMPSSSENKAGGVGLVLDENPIFQVPTCFYLFKEIDASISELKILFREHEDLKKDMVREKLKRIAFEMKFKIAQVADDRVKKILFNKDASIVAKERELEQIKKVLEKKVKQFDIWNKYLKEIKAVGPVIASGLIGELGGRHFDSDESLKHYAGMVAKKDFYDYNRYVKVILYQFAEGIIKHRTPKWRELYDNMRLFYAKKHADWSKGKVNNYAKKFIETKFLLEFWNKWRGIECYR